MEFQHHVSLKPYNTFGLDVKADLFCELNSLSDLKQALAENTLDRFLILGGGSNVLLSEDYHGLVMRNAIKGIELQSENESELLLKAYSGENWHELVQYCVQRNWGGIENLSLIPGTVGAAPMQNIGAYGVELEQVFHSLEAFNLHTFELETFNKEACAFGYRESVFKRRLKGQYFIYSVTFRLEKQARINASYGDIMALLEAKGLNAVTAGIQDVSEAVIQIRQSKLPDPAQLGNSGSFFKNPVISAEHFLSLKRDNPGIKGFDQPNGVKVPAAWLIEQCGWKGKRIGNTGSHEKQALVLVNYGGAKGEEIWRLAQDIIESVHHKFGIALEPEVNVI